MSEHHYVERVERRRGNYDVIIAAAVVLLVVMAVVFMVLLGGPTRFAGSGSTPSQTNVNVPAQQPARNDVQAPRQIDINVNQPAAPAPARQAPVQGAAPSQPQAPGQAPSGAQSTGPGR